MVASSKDSSGSIAPFLMSKPILSNAGKAYVKFPIQNAPTKLVKSLKLGIADPTMKARAQYSGTITTQSSLPAFFVSGGKPVLPR